MAKRTRMWMLGVAAMIAGVIVSVGSQWREPSHRGRGLTSWLKQGYDASLDETQKIAEAHQAINAIGAEKALPFLLEMVKARDGPLRSWVIEKNEKWNVRALKLREAAVIRQLGVVGFEALGTNCAPAVPELTGMLDDTNRALVALRCLVYIGGPAEKSVCRALTNRSPEVRAFAASQIGWVTDHIDVYLARLNGPLNDADATVRFAAVQALGLQSIYPEEILPLLVKAMHDPQQSISGYAAKFLGELGTNGIKAFAALSNVVETGTAYMATHALRSLISIDPDRALPMTLAWLRSSEADRRARAASVLGAFRAASPEILQALKNAMEDSDPKVVRSATASLRKFREAERQNGAGEVVVGGEPSYGGKRLGEWLKNKADTNGFSQEAQHAIREMGTNAIPALLARLVYKDEKFGLPDNEAAVEAVGGLVVLGQKALPALPRLEELVNGKDERVALLALMATCNLGTSSVPVLARALTNEHTAVRNQAVGLFRDGPMLAFPEARRDALPGIIRLLRDSDQSLRMNATNALKEIDPKAAAKAGVK